MTLPMSKEKCIEHLENAKLKKALKADSKWVWSKKELVEYQACINTLISIKATLDISDFDRLKRIRDEVNVIQIKAAEKSKKNKWYQFKADIDGIMKALNELLDSSNSGDSEIIRLEEKRKENERKQAEEKSKEKNWEEDCRKHKDEIKKYINTIKRDIGYLETDINKKDSIPPQAFDSPESNVQKLVDLKKYLLKDSQSEIEELVNYISGVFQKAKANGLDDTVEKRFESLIKKLSSLSKTQNTYSGKTQQKKLQEEHTKIEKNITRTTETKKIEAENVKRGQENSKKKLIIGFIIAMIITWKISPVLAIIIGIILIIFLLKS